MAGRILPAVPVDIDIAMVARFDRVGPRVEARSVEEMSRTRAVGGHHEHDEPLQLGGVVPLK